MNTHTTWILTDVVCSNIDQSLQDLDPIAANDGGGMFSPAIKNLQSSSGERQAKRGSLRGAQRDPGSNAASVTPSKSFAGTRDKTSPFRFNRTEVPNECLYDSAGGMFRGIRCPVALWSILKAISVFANVAASPPHLPLQVVWRECFSRFENCTAE